MKVINYILTATLSSIVVTVIMIHFYTPKQEVIYTLSSDRLIRPVDLLLDREAAKQFRSSTPTDFIEAASMSRPAVVYIESNDATESWRSPSDPSAGSGVVISQDGYIVTNYHVVEASNNIRVTLSDRRIYDATLIGHDINTDLALIKIEAEQLPYLVFGNSDSLQVGEWVLAVGNPFKLQSTVTAGIVSAKGRDIDILDMDYGIESYIQTDAAINPGNSGGALVNTSGNLIGISSAIMTYSGRFEGYSFAIPGNLARKVVSDLMEYGAVHRGLLGIEGTDVRQDMLKDLKLKEVSGILVTRITARSGASEAGIQSGDVILKVNNSKCHTMNNLSEIIGQYRPGDQIELTYARDGVLHITDVQLKNQLNTTDLISIRRDKILTNLGFEIRDLITSELERNQLEGVKVISIYKGSVIANTKMEPGYVITSINDMRVSSAQDFINHLDKLSGRIFLEGYYERHGGPWWYAFEK